MARKYLVDTNSLLSLVRQYLYFDFKDILFDRIEDAFMSGQCILLENVKGEAGDVDGGMILRKLNFLKDKYRVPVQANIVPNSKIHKRIDNNWCRGLVRIKMDDGEYSVRKEKAIYEEADLQLIIMAEKMNAGHPIIVTEENRKQDKNDGKLFKKIPLIADSEKIDCINLTELLTQLGVEIQYTTK